jgi:hypothetical protein
LTRHKIISLGKIVSHGQDHHGGSGQDTNSWLIDPQTSGHFAVERGESVMQGLVALR